MKTGRNRSGLQDAKQQNAEQKKWFGCFWAHPRLRRAVKNPAFWVIAFYTIKGTAVTAMMIGAALFAIELS